MDAQALHTLAEAEIVAAVQAQADESVALLKRLVAEPSLLGHEAIRPRAGAT